MADIHVEQLIKQVTDLSNALTHLGSGEDLKKLILVLKKPGWTTPAEFVFASANLESINAHAAALTKLKANLVKGVETVVAR